MRKKRHFKRRYRKQVRNDNKIEVGLCGHGRCQEKLVGDTKYCLKHWCSILKNNNHGKKKVRFDTDLLEIWKEQEGKCYITGIKLIPGRTASLDHITPLSRGGGNDKENLKFVHIAVNCMKSDSTLKEFSKMIKEIAPKLLEYSDKFKGD